MTENERAKILLNAKELFRNEIVGAHLLGACVRARTLEAYNINPFLLKYLANFLEGNDNPESIAKALIYPRLLSTSITTIGENVRGLLSHDNGKTLEGMISILDEIGYNVVSPVQVLKAINYNVPQKRERLILVAVRKDINIEYEYPKPFSEVYNLKDALKKGKLFESNVPKSKGAKYPQHKIDVLDLVPPKGYWRDLPLDVQKKYMQKSFFLGGGKTGMARRIGWDEPCLTLTCSPAQKQTERCHPDETRPFTVREYARIQTFPDDWTFEGSVSQQYKQIGNAVPVNLAKEIGYSIVKFLNNVYSFESNFSLISSDNAEIVS